MIVAYRYLLANAVNEGITLHPFIDGHSHHATRADMKRAVSVPDSQSLLAADQILLVEGDFMTIFSDHAGQYDVLVTHFFIDTARNLMGYLETIHSLLRPGGQWINFGPLLYGTAPWVQLSLDEIVHVCEAMGFEFADLGDTCGTLTSAQSGGGLGTVRSKDAAYGFNPRELRRNAYVAQAWMARKKVS